MPPIKSEPVINCVLRTQTNRTKPSSLFAQLLATHSSSYMKKANISNTFCISSTCLIITQPQKNSWSAEKTFICPKLGKTLTGDERTRTYLGCPYAAGPEQLEAPRRLVPLITAQRGLRAAPICTGDSLSLQQPLLTGNTKVKSKPPVQPSSLATPAQCLSLL